MCLFVNVVLVDGQGRVLLQERDEHAALDPMRWGLPGGAVEEGEDLIGCAVRELFEDTSLVVAPEQLEDLGTHSVFRPACGHEDQVAVYSVRLDVVQTDMVCGEGRPMVFVDPAEVTRLDVVEPARLALALALDQSVRKFSGAIVVDPRGWFLMQERDEHPLIDPEKWGLSGGHVDEGEDLESAAYRELEEETGLVLEPGSLLRFGEFVVDHTESYGTWDVMAVYAAARDLTDADIDCREGRRIVFVDPARVLDLDLTKGAGAIVPAFLDSDLYAALREQA